MNDNESLTIDFVCGMTVNEATALHADRDGKTYYFCGEACRERFLSTPPAADTQQKSGTCCG